MLPGMRLLILRIFCEVSSKELPALSRQGRLGWILGHEKTMIC